MAELTDAELASGALGNLLDRLDFSSTVQEATTVSHSQRRTVAEGAPDPDTGVHAATHPRGMAQMAAAKTAVNRTITEDEAFRRGYSGKPWWWLDMASGLWSSLVEHFATQDEHTLSGTRLPGLTETELNTLVAEQLQPRDVAAIPEARATRESIAGIHEGERVVQGAKDGLSLGMKVFLGAAGLLVLNSLLSD